MGHREIGEIGVICGKGGLGRSAVGVICWRVGDLEIWKVIYGGRKNWFRL